MNMPTRPDLARFEADCDVLRAAYAAFNARDIPAALALMKPDVVWPRAFKGGFVHGHDAVRAYWTEQWRDIDPHVEPLAFHPDGAGHILVEVRQRVRDPGGATIADERVAHRFTLLGSLVERMEVRSLPGAAAVAG